MINWRKPLLKTLLALSGNDMVRRFQEMKELCRLPADEIRKHQEERLKKILQHAFSRVPYYKRILGDAKVVNSNGAVQLENWNSIPFLTKDIIRHEFDSLLSDDSDKRHSYPNTSGGSTGEPVKFIQDREYKLRDMAGTLFFFDLAGKDLGEPEIKLWGSQRDVFEGTLGIKEKIQNFLYNRVFLNSFNMDARILPEYIRKWNAFKPKAIWTYVSSIYELARYIEKNSIEIHPPHTVICTSGTLTPEIRKYLERILKTRVFNQYGSREVGAIATECGRGHGLHILSWKQYLEVVDTDGKPCPAGKEGEIVITNLDNYSMPLIRFRIGDTGILGECDHSCGLNMPVLQQVTGRLTDHFRRRDGSMFHGQYFAFLFYFTPWVKKFQFVQENYDLVRVYIVPAGEKDQEKLDFVEQKIKLVLGENCSVDFVFVDDIPPSGSGKFLYTVSKVDPSEPKEQAGTK